jgi:aryl-alcohol dehydrogenase-like predicted oxidoreductase
VPNGEGASERTIGAWAASRGMRGRMLVASKGGHPPLTPPGGSRLRLDLIAPHLAESLDRLAMDSIDLYWLHRDDEAVPVDEILGALQPHLRRGAIRAIGASNWSWQRLEAAQACVAARGWTGFCASQISWSLASFAPDHRFGGGMLGMDAATLAWHARNGLAQIPYSAQANGFFAKPLDEAMRRLPQYADPANTARWQRVRDLAQANGWSANAVALAWLLCHPQGGFGIIGPKDRRQLADSLGAAGIGLSPGQVEVLGG